MKKILKRGLLSMTCLLVLTIGTFALCIFNPQWMYAESTEHGEFTILHNRPLPPGFVPALEMAHTILKGSELYPEDLHLRICLNDGGPYYRMHEATRGTAFGYGFSNIVCLGGNLLATESKVEINGSKWGLVPLLVHEMTHCLQYKTYGFWKSLPGIGHSDWVWEGYAEYISRPNRDLREAACLLSEAEKTNENGWFQLPDGTDNPLAYFRDALLVQYCLEEAGMSFDQLLHSPPNPSLIRQRLLAF